MRSVCLPKTTILNATRLKKEVWCRSRRGRVWEPRSPPFFLFFSFFFGRWVRYGCMRQAPTFVSHKQINFGRCFWWLICSKIGIFSVRRQLGEKVTLFGSLCYIRPLCNYVLFVFQYILKIRLNKQYRKFVYYKAMHCYLCMF